MQLRFGSFFYIYLTTLVVLLTWTSSTLGAAIDRRSSPSSRNLVGGTGDFGVGIWNDEVLKRDDDASLRRNTDEVPGTIDERNSLATRVTAENDDAEHDKPTASRRWYTLVEISEDPENE